MSSINLLALEGWSGHTAEGVLVVDPDGVIHLLNPRLQGMLGLESVPATVHELLDRVKSVSPQMSAVLGISPNSEHLRWGSLRLERFPAVSLVWEQIPLWENNVFRGSATVFRESAAHGQLDLARRSFLSMISHDLRTPLSTILGFTELLYNNLPTLTTEEQAEFLEHILKNANDLRSYTQIALDILFLESDLQEFEFEPVNLDQFIRHWLEDAIHRFPSDRILYAAPEQELPANVAPAALHRILYIVAEFALAESPDDLPVELAVRGYGSQALVEVRHLAPALRTEDAAGLLKMMHTRDLSEMGRPQLHRMQMYVASLLTERQKGCMTLQDRGGNQYEINLTFPLGQIL